MGITDELYKSPESQYSDAVDLGSFMDLASQVKKPFIQGSENFNPRIGPVPKGAPRGFELLESIYGGNDLAPSSADPDHMGHMHLAGNKIGKMGRYLQSLGFSVSENPKFGGVAPGVHSPTGWHPKGKAIDISYNGGGRWDAEAPALNWLETFIQQNYG